MENIRFEFVGGPHDGRIATGRFGEPSDAERFFLFTYHGRVGHRFKVASDYMVETLAGGLEPDQPRSFQRHYYVVTDRQEIGNEVCVRATYDPSR